MTSDEPLAWEATIPVAQQGYRAEVVLQEAARPMYRHTRSQAQVPLTNGVGIERARRVVTHLHHVVSNRTDRPFSPGPGRGEIRVEERCTLVVGDAVFSRNFPVRIRREVPVGAPYVAWLPGQNQFRLEGPQGGADIV